MEEYLKYYNFSQTGLLPTADIETAHKIAVEKTRGPFSLAAQVRAALFLQATLPSEDANIAVLPLIHEAKMSSNAITAYEMDFDYKIIDHLKEMVKGDIRDPSFAPEAATVFIAKTIGLISIHWEQKDAAPGMEEDFLFAYDSLKELYNRAQNMPIEPEVLTRTKQLIDDLADHFPKQTQQPPPNNNQWRNNR